MEEKKEREGKKYSGSQLECISQKTEGEKGGKNFTDSMFSKGEKET